MRRMILVMLLIIAVSLLAGLLYRQRPGAAAPLTGKAGVATDAKKTPGSYVFCQSILHFRTGERRWIATVQHPGESRAAVTHSLRQLEFPDMPPKPWEDGTFVEQFEVMQMLCMPLWKNVFLVYDPFYLGRGSAMLEDTLFPTEADYRRTMLRLLFNDQVAAAEAVFPLTPVPATPAP